MSKLSNAIGALRAGLLEAQEDAEAEEKKEEDNGALQSAG